jgi:phage protein D
MDFATRAERHNNLYAPAASIALGAPDRDMLRDHGLAVTQVEIDLQLSVAGQFRFTIPNTFDAGRADFLTPRGDRVLDLVTLGARVWIRMGYGDQRGQTLLISGFITAVATSFAEGGSPELEVSGSDATYKMTLGTREHRFENKTVRDAVGKVASDNGFELRFAGTPPSNVTLDSNMQSDLDFLIKMAQNFSNPKEKWEFYARAAKRGDELHFRPRQDKAAPVGTLKWGADLLSFKPEANLGNQVSKVEVHGWDEVGKKPILGVATAGGATAGATEGGQLQQRVFGRESVLQLRFPVKSKQEADERAAAELAKRANDHVKGEGETFGFPELLPDTNLRLDGLGRKFSTTYYVTKTVHRYESSGYRTRFSIEEPGIVEKTA